MLPIKIHLQSTVTATLLGAAEWSRGSFPTVNVEPDLLCFYVIILGFVLTKYIQFIHLKG